MPLKTGIPVLQGGEDVNDFKFKVDEPVRKVGGSYQGTGVIKAAFRADDGTARYVFRFDNPPGLLHIFNENQLEIILPDFWPNFK